jgi:hypothetical protein
MAQPPDLTVPMSPKECADRINGGTDPWWKLFGKRPVTGKLGRGGGTLYYRRLYVQNSFRPLLRVRFKAVDGGTLVRCRVDISHFVKAFSLLWLSIVLTFGYYITFPYLMDLVQGRRTATDPGGALFPILMLGFFAILVAFGRMLNRNDGPMLTRFVHNKLSGEGQRQYFENF